jgi:hypothetical protein
MESLSLWQPMVRGIVVLIFIIRKQKKGGSLSNDTQAHILFYIAAFDEPIDYIVVFPSI